ncbi:Increased rDNA silencing protein [Savitreella phatthalungensis]
MSLQTAPVPSLVGSESLVRRQSSHRSDGWSTEVNKSVSMSSPQIRPVATPTPSNHGKPSSKPKYPPGVLSSGASAVALRAAQLSSQKDPKPGSAVTQAESLSAGGQSKNGAHRSVARASYVAKTSAQASQTRSTQTNISSHTETDASLFDRSSTDVPRQASPVVTPAAPETTRILRPTPSRPAVTPYLAAASKAWSASATKLSEPAVSQTQASWSQNAGVKQPREPSGHVADAWKHRSSDNLPLRYSPDRMPVLHLPSPPVEALLQHEYGPLPGRSRSAGSDHLAAEINQFMESQDSGFRGPLAAARTSFAQDRDMHAYEQEIGMNTEPLSQHGFSRPASRAAHNRPPSVFSVQQAHRDLASALQDSTSASARQLQPPVAASMGPPVSLSRIGVQHRAHRSVSNLPGIRHSSLSPPPHGLGSTPVGRVSMDDAGARAALTAASLSFAEHPPRRPLPGPGDIGGEPHQYIPHRIGLVTLRSDSNQDATLKVKFLKKGRIRGISQEERKRYERLWATNKGLCLSFVDLADDRTIEDPASAAKDDVANVVVRDIWSRSRLQADVLEQIYDLCDRGSKGRLTRDEFVVGTWLVDHSLRGRRLPTRRELTDEVFTSGGPLARLGIKVPKRLRREEKKWLRPATSNDINIRAGESSAQDSSDGGQQGSQADAGTGHAAAMFMLSSKEKRAKRSQEKRDAKDLKKRQKAEARLAVQREKARIRHDKLAARTMRKASDRVKQPADQIYSVAPQTSPHRDTLTRDPNPAIRSSQSLE